MSKENEVFTDDLVKRLCDRRVCSPAQNSCRNDWVLDQAADRIEELEAERDDYANRLMQADNTYTEMHLHIEELEAKLAKAVEALYVIEGWSNKPAIVVSKVRTTLAELKGGKDAKN